MGKSFGEILDTSFFAFRKSFLSILGLYVGTLVLALLGGIFSALLFGRQAASLLPMLKSGNIDSNVFSSFLPQLIIIAGIIFILVLAFYFISLWQILIIRNNIVVGKGFLKQSFFETLRKTPKLIFFWILATVALILSFGILTLLLKKAALIFVIPAMIFLGPIAFVINNGILCREGKLWDIVLDSFDVGFHNWGKIFGYTLLFMVCMVICLTVVTIISYFVAKTNGVIFGIFRFIMQFVVQIFSMCFFTAFYLDLVGISSAGTEQIIEPSEPIEKIVPNVEVIEEDLNQYIENVNQDVNQEVKPQEGKNEEPPHMDVLK